MPQSLQSAQQLFLRAGRPGRRVRIAGMCALPLGFGKRQFRKFHRTSQVPRCSLVMNRQVLACNSAVPRVLYQFQPK
jgi:hypothetical protein